MFRQARRTSAPLSPRAGTAGRHAAGDDTAGDLARLLLRLGLAVLLLLHGLAKVVDGPGGVMGMLRAHELPGALAYGVYVGEVLAPLLLLAGWWTRLAALLVVVNMLVAVALAHRADLFVVTAMGGWALELQGLYLLVALAIALLGAGRFSVGGVRGRFN